MPRTPDAPDVPESLEQLHALYQEGVDDPSVPSARLSMIALAIAKRYDEAHDEAAGPWYRVAATAPRWTDDEWLLSWPNAVLGYMLWAHRTANEELCEAWAFKLVEDAAENGPQDRAYLAGESKNYRDEWQIRASADAARYSALHHLLTEHRLPKRQTGELIRLLSKSHRFSQEDWDQIRHLVDTAWTADRSWEAVAWLLDKIAAPLFSSIPGFGEAASACQSLARQDPRTLDSRLWGSRIRLITRQTSQEQHPARSDMWGHLHFLRFTREKISALLGRVGLGERRNLYQLGWASCVEETLWENPDDGSWRLLRGSETWLEMFGGAASEGQGDAWMSAWDTAGSLVILALQREIETLSDQMGIDWSKGIGPEYLLAGRWDEHVEFLRPAVRRLLGENAQD